MCVQDIYRKCFSEACIVLIRVKQQKNSRLFWWKLRPNHKTERHFQTDENTTNASFITTVLANCLTLYSGNCRRKEQARTSSQWKVPLCVPIFLTVMLSVQSLLRSLDMYICTEQVWSTENKLKLMLAWSTRKMTLLLNNEYDVLTKLIGFIWTNQKRAWI